jgi:predicted nucleotidyltransferase
MTLSAEALFQLRRGEQLLREREVRRRDLRVLAERIATMLRTEFNATQVWVFGSVVRPWFHEESDLDLAVEGIAPSRQAEAQECVAALATVSVDLVFLEEAPLTLRERILTDGDALADR